MKIIGNHLLGSGFSGYAKLEEPRILRSVSSQTIPAFIYEEYPRFVEFIESFMEFIELKYNVNTDEFSPGPYFILKKLIDTADIDKAATEYLQFFKRTYARDFPNVTEQEIRSLLKRIRDFYLRKGTRASFDFFFRSVFASFSEIYLPKVDMLRVSDGKWEIEYQVRFRRIDGDQGYLSPEELIELFDASIRGNSSSSRAWIGFPVQALIIGSIDPEPKYWVPILSRQGEFTPGETVTATLRDGSIRTVWIGETDSLQVQPGKWLNSDGFISSDKKIQDSFFWQDFSYVIKTDSFLAEFTNPMINTLHPAGLMIFASVEDIQPTIISVYPDDFTFLYHTQLIIWLRNWDIITGIAEIPEIPDLDGSSLSLKMKSISEGQAFFDWGLAGATKELEDISSIYDNLSGYDDVFLEKFEKGNPNGYLFVEWIGKKIISTDDELLGATDSWKNVRINKAEFGGYEVSSDGAPMSTLESNKMGALERFSVRTLPYSDTGTFMRVVGEETTSDTHIFIEDLPDTDGQYLTFVDGKYVPPTADFGWQMESYPFLPPRRNRIHVKNPNYQKSGKSVIEVMIISSDNLGEVPKIRITHQGTQIGPVFLFRKKAFNFVDHDPGFVPASRSPWDILVFRSSQFSSTCLRPIKDYFLSDDGSTITLTGPGMLANVEELNVYFLEPNQSSYAQQLVPVEISGNFILPKPTGSMFDIVPGRLSCRGLYDQAVLWQNFDQENFTLASKSFVDTVDPSVSINPFSGATFSLGELMTDSAPNGSETWQIGSGQVESFGGNLNFNSTMQGFRSTDTAPFSISFRYMSPVGGSGSLAIGYNGTFGLTFNMAIAPFDDSRHNVTVSITDTFGTSVLFSELLLYGTFHTATFAYDSTSAYLYINGQSVASDSVARSNVPLFDSVDPFTLFGFDDGTEALSPGTQIDMFAVFSSALGPIEMKALHNSGKGLAGRQRYF